MKKQLIISAIVLSILGSATFVGSQAFAQTSGQDTIVQMIADKFHLNKSDVQSVFDQHQTTRLQERQQKIADRLTQAVKDGKITEAQKSLIENKLKELAANRQSSFDKFKDMTQDERRAEMQKQKQALDDWAAQNGIDPQYLFPGFGMGMQSMHGRGHMRDW